MAYLVDTNILLRSLQPAHPHYEPAVHSVESLLNQGETVYYCAQNVREFWNVCTRPADNNGMGMTVQQVVDEVSELQSALTFLPDSPDVFTEWRRLVETYSVRGVQVHDANLVAVMNVAGISHLLTFNPSHFRRFAKITVIDPNNPISSPTE